MKDVRLRDRRLRATTLAAIQYEKILFETSRVERTDHRLARLVGALWFKAGSWCSSSDRVNDGHNG